MIIHLNGWPGVGKLTVGRIVARELGGHLVDNHTLHNVAACLCERNTAEYWQLYYQVQEIAYARMQAMPKSAVFVMTNALTRESEREVEAWNAVRQLAADRLDTLVAVTLVCSSEENAQRVRSEERANNRKLTDPEPLRAWQSELTLITEGADYSQSIDNTNLAPQEAAGMIADFVGRLR